jgi:hypothetical protein
MPYTRNIYPVPFMIAKTYSACSEYGKAYENGFSAGCQSVEGNTNDSCHLTIEINQTIDDYKNRRNHRCLR